jgi:YHS domain-containing protein
MNNGRMQTSIIVVLVGLLLLGLPGCTKKSKPAPSPSTRAKTKTAGGTPATVTAVGAIAQTTCPVMDGNPIDKNVFTEYKGKKVYFCCQDCAAKFKAEPEKYAANLPQFKK